MKAPARNTSRQTAVRPASPSSAITMLQRLALAAAFAFAGHACAIAQPLLVSEQEMLASLSAGENPITRSLTATGAPRIELAAPDIRQSISSPTRIALRFVPTAPASIRPESLRVLYGALRLDITSRLLGSAKVNPEGIEVAQAALPRGQHRLTLMLEDTLGRAASHTFAFIVD
jgi:hypothetical protein